MKIRIVREPGLHGLHDSGPLLGGLVQDSEHCSLNNPGPSNVGEGVDLKFKSIHTVYAIFNSLVLVLFYELISLVLSLTSDGKIAVLIST